MGKVYAPLPCYSQSGDKLDQIIEEIAAIINPKCFPGHHMKFFMKLPETDPAAKHNTSKKTEQSSKTNAFKIKSIKKQLN